MPASRPRLRVAVGTRRPTQRFRVLDQTGEIRNFSIADRPGWSVQRHKPFEGHGSIKQPHTAAILNERQIFEPVWRVIGVLRIPGARMEVADLGGRNRRQRLVQHLAIGHGAFGPAEARPQPRARGAEAGMDEDHGSAIKAGGCATDQCRSDGNQHGLTPPLRPPRSRPSAPAWRSPPRPTARGRGARSRPPRPCGRAGTAWRSRAPGRCAGCRS